MTEATPEREWWHGTITGYYGKDYRCRCDDCRAAARRYYHEKVKNDRKPCGVEGCTKLARPRNRACDGRAKRLRATGDYGTAETLVMGGDDSGYDAAHRRVYRTRGRARAHVCSQCENRQAYDWAYIHGSPGEKPSGVARNGRPHGPYSLNPEHYVPMCKPCHKAFDLDAAGKAPGKIRQARMRREQQEREAS